MLLFAGQAIAILGSLGVSACLLLDPTGHLAAMAAAVHKCLSSDLALGACCVGSVGSLWFCMNMVH